MTNGERDRMWCMALLPEGADVIQRVTGRFIGMRDAPPPPGAQRVHCKSCGLLTAYPMTGICDGCLGVDLT